MNDRTDGGPSGHAEKACRHWLAALFPEARFFACEDIDVRKFTDDPQACGPGDCFVARCGDEDDGHEQIAQAIAGGAGSIIAERMVPTDGVPLCVVTDTAWAWARLVHAMEGMRGNSLRVIAITGTSGKTSTAWLTASMLSEAGLRVGVVSDLGCIDANTTLPQREPLTDARQLAGWLRRIEQSGCTHAVVEVSSQMLAAHGLAGVSCHTVAVTNLGRAHLDLHGTTAAYHAVKERILDAVADTGCLVANVDDPRVVRLVERYQKQLPSGCLLTAGLQSEATVTASPVERSLNGQTLLLDCDGVVMPVSLEVPVTSTARNAVLAAAIATREGVPAEWIARGLESTGSIVGRISRHDRGQDFAVFVDRPSSGHALASTLASLRQLTPGKLVVVVEEEVANRLGGKRRFAARAARWCNASQVVPPGIASEQPTSRDLAAYARLDQQLSRLGADDCLLVLGSIPRSGPQPFDPDDTFMPLEAVVSGWLELAHQPEAPWGRRRAA
jgi:UDP-N-acetylmuramoyl-L-alanyl-D-glutamate--2,6-diaminopimelate ligase